jgi:hypothetical protein
MSKRNRHPLSYLVSRKRKTDASWREISDALFVEIEYDLDHKFSSLEWNTRKGLRETEILDELREKLLVKKS